MIGYSDSRQSNIEGSELLCDGVLRPLRGGGLTATVQLGPGGRVVIPVEMREAMGLNQGDSVVMSLDHGELNIVSLAASIRELQAMTEKYFPGDRSLADELIAERRKEAARE